MALPHRLLRLARFTTSKASFTSGSATASAARISTPAVTALKPQSNTVTGVNEAGWFTPAQNSAKATTSSQGLYSPRAFLSFAREFAI